MKTGTSTLNPYATSYIPLSKRAAVAETKDVKVKDEESRTGNVDASAQPDIDNVPSLDTFWSSKSPKLKGHPVYGNYGSSSHHAYDLTEKQVADEFEMDMAYLQMTFPGISGESLSDVYLVNNCDLEAAVDMLNQLELHSDFSEKLPDTLDIGDVAAPGASTEFASQKLKNVTDVTVASSSGSNSP